MCTWEYDKIIPWDDIKLLKVNTTQSGWSKMLQTLLKEHAYVHTHAVF